MKRRQCNTVCFSGESEYASVGVVSSATERANQPNSHNASNNNMGELSMKDSGGKYN